MRCVHRRYSVRVQAMEVADRFRASLPLKKTDKARIWCFRTMLETVDAMEETQTNLDYVGVIRRLLDMHGRLRCTAAVAADFVKVPTHQPISVPPTIRRPIFHYAIMAAMAWRKVMAAYRRVYDSVTHVTCTLTAKNWDQLRNHTLGSRVRATLPLMAARQNNTVQYTHIHANTSTENTQKDLKNSKKEEN